MRFRAYCLIFRQIWNLDIPCGKPEQEIKIFKIYWLKLMSLYFRCSKIAASVDQVHKGNQGSWCKSILCICHTLYFRLLLMRQGRVHRVDFPGRGRGLLESRKPQDRTKFRRKPKKERNKKREKPKKKNTWKRAKKTEIAQRKSENWKQIEPHPLLRNCSQKSEMKKTHWKSSVISYESRKRLNKEAIHTEFSVLFYF